MRKGLFKLKGVVKGTARASTRRKSHSADKDKEKKTRLNPTQNFLPPNFDQEDFSFQNVAECGWTGSATVLAYDPVQRLIAVGCDDGSFYIVGQQDVSLRGTLPSSASITHLHFDINKGGLLCVAGADKMVFYIDITAANLPVTATHSLEHIVTAALLPPLSSWLLLGTQRGNVHVLHSRTLQPVKDGIAYWNNIISVTDKAQPGEVISLAEMPQEPQLLLVAYIASVALYDFKGRSHVASFTMQGAGPIRCLQSNPYKKGSFVVGTGHGQLVHWNKKSTNPERVEAPLPGSSSGTYQPIGKVAWIPGKHEPLLVYWAGVEAGDEMLVVGGKKGYTKRKAGQPIADFALLSPSLWPQSEVATNHVAVLHSHEIAIVDIGRDSWTSHPHCDGAWLASDTASCLRLVEEVSTETLSMLKGLGELQTAERGLNAEPCPVQGGKPAEETVQDTPRLLLIGNTVGKVNFVDLSADSFKFLYATSIGELCSTANLPQPNQPIIKQLEWSECSGELTVCYGEGEALVAKLALDKCQSSVIVCPPIIQRPLLQQARTTWLLVEKESHKRRLRAKSESELDRQRPLDNSACQSESEEDGPRARPMATSQGSLAAPRSTILSFGSACASPPLPGQAQQPMEDHQKAAQTTLKKEYEQTMAPNPETGEQSCEVACNDNHEIEIAVHEAVDISLAESSTVAEEKQSKCEEEDKSASPQLTPKDVTEQWPEGEPTLIEYEGRPGFQPKLYIPGVRVQDQDETQPITTIAVQASWRLLAIGGHFGVATLNMDDGEILLAESLKIPLKAGCEPQDCAHHLWDTPTYLGFSHAYPAELGVAPVPMLLVGTANGNVLAYQCVPGTDLSLEWNVESTNGKPVASVAVADSRGRWLHYYEEMLEAGEDEPGLTECPVSLNVETDHQLVFVGGHGSMELIGVPSKTTVWQTSDETEDNAVILLRPQQKLRPAVAATANTQGLVCVYSIANGQCHWSTPTGLNTEAPIDISHLGHLIGYSFNGQLCLSSIMTADSHRAAANQARAFDPDLPMPHKPSHGFWGLFAEEIDRDTLFSVVSKPEATTPRRASQAETSTSAKSGSLATTMGENKERLMERGAKIGQLEDMTDRMQDTAGSMLGHIRSYNERQANKKWWQL